MTERTTPTTFAGAKHHHLHAIFRRQVCHYLSTCGNNDALLKEMETCLGRYALQHDTGLSLVNGSPASTDNDAIDMRVPPHFVHCHGCGSCLRGRVRIHSIARGRTRRRRASRKLAAWKKEQNRQSQHQVQQHHPQQHIKQATNSNASDVVPTPVDERELQRLFRVTDGTCKNIVVQTCDHCGVQRKMQGMPANKQQAKKVAIAVDKRKTGKKNATNDGDYLALPAAKQPRSAATFQQPQMSFLAGNKKKKKPEPKSGLMNFLSSLNH